MTTQYIHNQYMHMYKHTYVLYNIYIYSNDDNDASKSKYENLIQHTWTHSDYWRLNLWRTNPCKSRGGNQEKTMTVTSSLPVVGQRLPIVRPWQSQEASEDFHNISWHFILGKTWKKRELQWWSSPSYYVDSCAPTYIPISIRTAMHDLCPSTIQYIYEHRFHLYNLYINDRIHTSQRCTWVHAVLVWIESRYVLIATNLWGHPNTIDKFKQWAQHCESTNCFVVASTFACACGMW